MGKSIAAIIVGIFVWIAVATLLNDGLRVFIEGYRAAEPTYAFTLTMKLARLGEAALSSLAAGAAAAWIARPSRWAPWVTGAIFLAMFLPVHIRLGNALPLWYHLTFLVTLVPLFGAGAALVPRKPAPHGTPAGTAPG